MPSVRAAGSVPAKLAGLGAVVLWAFFAPIARFADGIPPFALTAGGFAIAFAAGLGFLALRGRLSELRQGPWAWAHGVGGLFGFHASYFLGMRLAPPTQVTVIGYVWPLLTVLFSVPLLGLRLRPRHLAGIGLGLLACLLLAGQTGRFVLADWPGYALGLCAPCIWGLYSALSGRMAKVPTGALVGFYGAVALLSGLAHLVLEAPARPVPGAVAAMAALGLGPMGLAFFLWDFGIKRGDPRALSILGYATPVLSYLLLCALGFAAFTPLAVLAATLVCAGGLLAVAG